MGRNVRSRLSSYRLGEVPRISILETSSSYVRASSDSFTLLSEGSTTPEEAQARRTADDECRPTGRYLSSGSVVMVEARKLAKFADALRDRQRRGDTSTGTS